MFSKLSRYYKVPNVTVPDAQGRVLASKDLRLLPQVNGTFKHTIQASDRLDHLSCKYYDQPVQWWQICDANPEFLSPLALLGDEVIVMTRFPLKVTSGELPPWEALFRELYDVLGVEDVQVIENVEIVPEEQSVDGQTVTVFVDRYSWEVCVIYNCLNTNRETLAERIEAAEFKKVEGPVDIGQLGREIIIPPKATG